MKHKVGHWRKYETGYDVVEKRAEPRSYRLQGQLMIFGLVAARQGRDDGHRKAGHRRAEHRRAGMENRNGTVSRHIPRDPLHGIVC
jgi:hypothetical protein